MYLHDRIVTHMFWYVFMYFFVNVLLCSSSVSCIFTFFSNEILPYYCNATILQIELKRPGVLFPIGKYIAFMARYRYIVIQHRDIYSTLGASIHEIFSLGLQNSRRPLSLCNSVSFPAGCISDLFIGTLPIFIWRVVWPTTYKYKLDAIALLFHDVTFWTELFESRLIFRWSLFLRVQLTIVTAMVQIKARRRPGDKSLSLPMMVNLPSHICVTRP